MMLISQKIDKIFYKTNIYYKGYNTIHTMASYTVRQQLIQLLNVTINSIEKHLDEIRTNNNHNVRDMMSYDYQYFYKKLSELKMYRITIDIRPLTMDELNNIENNPFNNIKYCKEMLDIKNALDDQEDDDIEDFKMFTVEDMNDYLSRL